MVAVAVSAESPAASALPAVSSSVSAPLGGFLEAVGELGSEFGGHGEALSIRTGDSGCGGSGRLDAFAVAGVPEALASSAVSPPALLVAQVSLDSAADETESDDEEEEEEAPLGFLAVSEAVCCDLDSVDRGVDFLLRDAVVAVERLPVERSAAVFSLYDQIHYKRQSDINKYE